MAFLAAQPDVIAAYLFGSLAEGRATLRSDVDLAVLLDTADPTIAGERQLQLMGDLRRFADREGDVVILNTAPVLLQHQVLSHGRLLYERNRQRRVEFEVRTGQIYADQKPLKDFFAQALFRELREVGLGGRRRRRTGTITASAERDGLPEK